MRGGKKWFLATWPLTSLIEAIALADNLKGLRNRKVHLNGQELPWDEVFGFLWCFRQRDHSYRPPAYCFGVEDGELDLCGCKQAGIRWSPMADWLSFGQFTKESLFVFDKQRIAHSVRENLRQVRLCPYLKMDLVQAVLRLLPQEARVSERAGWKYREDYQESPTSMKVVVKEKEDGDVFTREFYADGVEPIGFDLARDIIARAFKACGFAAIDVKSLFS